MNVNILTIPFPTVYRVQELAHAGALKLIHAATPDLDNEAFQAAYIATFNTLVDLLLQLITSELSDRNVPPALPSAG
jgi:hypothetical protein